MSGKRVPKHARSDAQSDEVNTPSKRKPNALDKMTASPNKYLDGGGDAEPPIVLSTAEESLAFTRQQANKALAIDLKNRRVEENGRVIFYFLPDAKASNQVLTVLLADADDDSDLEKLQSSYRKALANNNMQVHALFRKLSIWEFQNWDRAPEGREVTARKTTGHKEYFNQSQMNTKPAHIKIRETE